MAQRIAFDLTEEDFNESGGAFAPIEPGTYNVEISEAEMTNSSQKGTLGYSLRYKSVDDSFKGNLFENIWITPKTLGKSVKQFLRAAGRGPLPTLEDPSIPEADELIGAELTVTVIHETYEKDGEEKIAARVKGFSWKSVGSGGNKKADDGSFSL